MKWKMIVALVKYYCMNCWDYFVRVIVMFMNMKFGLLGWTKGKLRENLLCSFDPYGDTRSQTGIFFTDDSCNQLTSLAWLSV